MVCWYSLEYVQDCNGIDEYDFNQADTYKIIDIGIHYVEYCYP